MFTPFLQALRKEGIPVSLREYLGFLEAMEAELALFEPEGFYHLSRAILVKDERFFDRFDRVFSAVFGGLSEISAEAVINAIDLPQAWLEKLAEKYLSDEEKALIEGAGGFEELMKRLRERLAEQKGRHQGGSKWIGTAGTSPFGAYGYNPEGVRIGQDKSRNQRAVKVWDRREFRDFDDQAELGTRTIKIALRRLRRWVREGAGEELDLPGTIRATADHGWLDVQTRPERRNAQKVVMFLDVGGSMDWHIKAVEELFSAARSEFKNLEYYYFHNCLYEHVWRDNRRRFDERIATRDLMNRLGPSYKCIFVGDASMSPYEITHAGGANEHWNPEAGAIWLDRARTAWPNHLWINPLPEAHWRHTHSVKIISHIFGEDRMVPMTLAGIERGVRLLGR